MIPRTNSETEGKQTLATKEAVEEKVKTPDQINFVRQISPVKKAEETKETVQAEPENPQKETGGQVLFGEVKQSPEILETEKRPTVSDKIAGNLKPSPEEKGEVEPEEDSEAHDPRPIEPGKPKEGPKSPENAEKNESGCKKMFILNTIF